MKPTLLVLAAGIGSRYGGLKQIDPVGPAGETIIDYCLYDAIRAGFGKVVFVIRHDIEKDFKEAVTSKFQNRITIEYAFQELDKLPPGFSVPAGRKKPWGTGHAILMAADQIREPFAMINADDFYGAESFRVLAKYLQTLAPTSNAYSMVGFVLRNTLSEHGTVARGICRVDANRKLTNVVEMLKIAKAGTAASNLEDPARPVALTADEYCSMNMWGFTPTLFGHLADEFPKFLSQFGQQEKSEFLIPSVVNTLVQTGRVSVEVLPTGSSWFGVTYKEDRPTVLASIRALIDKGEYPPQLWT
jgi:dTDP-glucose pyrophosphorylase